MATKVFADTNQPALEISGILLAWYYSTLNTKGYYTTHKWTHGYYSWLATKW